MINKTSWKRRRSSALISRRLSDVAYMSWVCGHESSYTPDTFSCPWTTDAQKRQGPTRCPHTLFPYGDAQVHLDIEASVFPGIRWIARSACSSRGEAYTGLHTRKLGVCVPVPYLLSSCRCVDALQADDSGEVTSIGAIGCWAIDSRHWRSFQLIMLNECGMYRDS